MAENERAVRGATAWHPPFYDLLAEGAPPTIEVRTEVVLSQQPRRADLLLLRRNGEPARDHEARVLRGLWPLLGPVTLAEFKGPSSGFRPGDLLRLYGYGLQYHELNVQELPGPSALTLALFTPALTPSVRAAIEHMERWRLESLGSGYARILGACYTILIAFIDEVCEAERDDYLRLFSRHEQQSREAMRWLNMHFLRMTSMDNVHDLEGYDELVARLLEVLPPEDVLRHYKPEERLAGLAPEDVLRHYKPEERLAGLAPEDIVRHCGPDLFLRYLRNLAPDDQAEFEKALPVEVLDLLRKYLSRSS
jgi:hypothetical protein